VTDLGFIAAERDGRRGFAVYAGGGLGGGPVSVRVRRGAAGRHAVISLA